MYSYYIIYIAQSCLLCTFGIKRIDKVSFQRYEFSRFKHNTIEGTSIKLIIFQRGFYHTKNAHDVEMI